jgi:hypothetical protein
MSKERRVRRRGGGAVAVDVRRGGEWEKSSGEAAYLNALVSPCPPPPEVRTP